LFSGLAGCGRGGGGGGGGIVAGYGGGLFKRLKSLGNLLIVAYFQGV